MANISEDYYHDIYYSETNIVLSICGWLMTEIFGNALLFLMIEIEPDLQFRTILNGIYSSIMKILLMYNLFVVNIDFLRMLLGPLPMEVCLLLTTLRSNFTFQLQFLFAETFCFRMLFLIVWENIGYFNEDLLGKFINIFNFFITVFIQVIMTWSNDIARDIRVI